MVWPGYGYWVLLVTNHARPRMASMTLPLGDNTFIEKYESHKRTRSYHVCLCKSTQSTYDDIWQANISLSLWGDCHFFIWIMVADWCWKSLKSSGTLPRHTYISIWLFQYPVYLYNMWKYIPRSAKMAKYTDTSGIYIGLHGITDKNGCPVSIFKENINVTIVHINYTTNINWDIQCPNIKDVWIDRDPWNKISVLFLPHVEAHKLLMP